jgi:hypothetical protein
MIQVQSAVGIKIVTGDSSITLNKNGTIDIVGKTVNIQGTDAINANAAKNVGKVVQIGTSAQTKITVNASTIDSISTGAHKVQGSEVDIN